MRNPFVYFDLGNVLVTFDHAIATRQLAELGHCTFDRAQYALFDSGLEIQYESGLLTDDQFTCELNRQLDTQLATADVIEAVSAIFEPNLAILPALEHIKASGVPMGLLSNTCDGHWQWIKRRAWATVENWFDPIVLSYEAKLMKPDPAIYDYCELQCQRAPQDIFFTDDRDDNIRIASACGWATYQFGTPNGLIQAFDDWLQRRR